MLCCCHCCTEPSFRLNNVKGFFPWYFGFFLPLSQGGQGKEGVFSVDNIISVLFVKDYLFRRVLVRVEMDVNNLCA